MIVIPRNIAAYSDLAAEFKRLLSDAFTLANDQDGLTPAESRAILAQSAAVFVQVVASYSYMSGEQKKALVDETLAALLGQLKPYIVGGAQSLVAVALPWYLRWLPYVVGWLVQWDAVGALSAEIPAISQAAYDAAKFIWTKIKKG